MAKKGTSAVPSVGHSGPSAVKARLLEVAAKVRQVPRALKDGPDLLHRGWMALGRLTRKAYEAGAWQREGSLIGDGLRLALTAAGCDDPHQLAGETVPKWVLDAWGAGVGTLTGNLIPPAPIWDEGRQVEWEAGILADEIEREADRFSKQTKSRQRPPVSMDDEDEKILRRLAQSPLRLFALIELPVSNKTAGTRVNAMIDRGWACRPKGKNGGVQITPAGSEIAKEAGLIDRK